jgi:hypothetical protein
VTREIDSASLSTTRRIDDFLPRFDVHEIHRMRFAAPPAEVWRALWEADLASSWWIRGLMALRALPALLFDREKRRIARGPWNLRALAGAGFGFLAEEPEREVVLGVEGRFWRPAGNLERFDRARFDRPLEAGLARAVWNFVLEPDGSGATLLTTETRVLCGDPASRRRFRAYWFFVRPGSGLIRRLMLAAVRRRWAATSRRS